MGNVRTLVSDPEFGKLSIAEQREALSRFDPEFKNFNDSEIGEFKIKFNRPSTSNQINYSDIEKKTGPQLKSDSTLGQIQRSIIRGFPTIGGAIGGAIGGVPGAAAGGAIGSAIENAPRFISGDPKEATKDILGDALYQGG